MRNGKPPQLGSWNLLWWKDINISSSLVWNISLCIENYKLGECAEFWGSLQGLVEDSEIKYNILKLIMG